ncbi:MAG: 6-phosphogluconolactonase [Candidatus Theseobacter exili]|nr:6-phosphogluconolactonase [Candidatus Theseobacter exili]
MKTHTFETIEELSASAAQTICDLTIKAISKNSLFTLALSGGTTPQSLYQKLSNKPFKDKMPWKDIHFFFGDERMVSYKNPLSNFYTAKQRLFSLVPVSESNIHKIPTENNTPAEASKKYEKVLKNFFSFQKSIIPVFDVIILGVGQDGHTASLFPGDITLKEKEKLTVAVDSPKSAPMVSRVSLTLPVINAARNVVFLVSGKNKTTIINQVFNEYSKEKTKTLPAAMVQPEGNLIWFIGK